MYKIRMRTQKPVYLIDKMGFCIVGFCIERKSDRKKTILFQ